MHSPAFLAARLSLRYTRGKPAAKTRVGGLHLHACLSAGWWMDGPADGRGVGSRV
jgi:hypothetical protein